MKNALMTLLITVSVVLGMTMFGGLLVASKMHSVHAVTGEVVNALGNGGYFLITVMSILTAAIVSVIVKERHFA